MSVANPFDIDLDDIVQRVVLTLRQPTDMRPDLLQEGNLLGLELIRRFEPRSGPSADTPGSQLERYLFVSLRWQLRAYARRLRASIVIPERDRRLVHDYHALIAAEGPLTRVEAANRLGVQPSRLTAALASQATVISLDQPAGSGDDRAAALSDTIAAVDSSPEQVIAANLDESIGRLREDVVGRVGRAAPGAPPKGRGAKRRAVLALFLDQLSDADAEVIRLSYGLTRKEVGGLPACRAYGCRLSAKHRHSTEDLARWIAGDPARIGRQLAAALDQLGDFLGGRDPRPLLEDAGGPARRGTDGE